MRASACRLATIHAVLATDRFDIANGPIASGIGAHIVESAHIALLASLAQQRNVSYLQIWELI